ncbi:MAG: DMT family transporter [Candidatus Cryosericum sp.]
MEHEENDHNTELEPARPPKASADQSQYRVGNKTDDEERRNKRGGILFIAAVMVWSLAAGLYSLRHPNINVISIVDVAIPTFILAVVTIVVFTKEPPQPMRGVRIERWLFGAMFLWPVVLLLGNYIPTATRNQLMSSLLYTGSPIFAAVLAVIGGRHYPASRRFLKWLAAMVLTITLFFMAVVWVDSLQHGWRWIRSATESPISWLDLDLVVLSVLFLLVPERKWKQNRRTVAITLALLLTVSLGGYLVSLSQKGAVRLQTGYDMAQQVKWGSIPSENVPDFVLNGTDTYTIDFSETVTLVEMRDTRTIFAEVTFPGSTPEKMFVQLYLCQPLSSRTVKLADGTIAYSGPGYPQLVKGRSYRVTGVLEKNWQVSPRVFVPSAANIQEQ